ncbi:MAG: 50S ribosomal protein L30 [Chloroflexi bacterium]|nr:50S ribosomal protein L30 [Chloroflexota bacterium]
MSKIRIQWKKSATGYPKEQGRVVRALGLKRLNQEVERENTPSILGMVHKVRHLVQVRQGEE